MKGINILDSNFREPLVRAPILIKAKVIPEKKNYHLSLKGESIARMEWLQSKVSSGTQTEVFASALQLFEELLKEHENGSTFYIKRAEHDNYEKYDLFEPS
jgi:hypothetical protein